MKKGVAFPPGPLKEWKLIKSERRTGHVIGGCSSCWNAVEEAAHPKAKLWSYWPVLLPPSPVVVSQNWDYPGAETVADGYASDSNR